jgi:hypothetical protein
MKHVTAKFCKVITVVSVVTALVSFVNCRNVLADGIPLNIIGPHEYALPVNYQPFNAVVQYGYFQTGNQVYESNGNKVDAPLKTSTAVGFTKYARFFKIDSLPDVGIGWEVVVPAISVQGTGLSVSGIGDPLTGGAIWIKPSKNSTIGFQSFLSVPVGASEVSDKTWGSLNTIIGDVQLGPVNIDGQVGYIIKSDRHTNGAADIEPGNTFHTNLRLAYSVHKYFEPYIAFDYQSTNSSKAKTTGLTMANSSSNETTLGGGAVMNITDSIGLAVRYDVGVDGKNTGVTNALNFKVSCVW